MIYYKYYNIHKRQWLEFRGHAVFARRVWMLYAQEGSALAQLRVRSALKVRVVSGQVYIKQGTRVSFVSVPRDLPVKRELSERSLEAGHSYDSGAITTLTKGRFKGGKSRTTCIGGVEFNCSDGTAIGGCTGSWRCP
jgi:hypothetical protein